MREYGFTEARQHLVSLPEEVKKEEVGCIRKRDGESF